MDELQIEYDKASAEVLDLMNNLETQRRLSDCDSLAEIREAGRRLKEAKHKLEHRGVHVEETHASQTLTDILDQVSSHLYT